MSTRKQDFRDSCLYSREYATIVAYNGTQQLPSTSPPNHHSQHITNLYCTIGEISLKFNNELFITFIPYSVLSFFNTLAALFPLKVFLKAA